MHLPALLRGTAALALLAVSLYAGAQAPIDLTAAGHVPTPTRPLVAAPAGGAFFDDFNRADGPLGANWTVVSGGMQVVGNRADNNFATRSRAIAVSASGSVVEMDVAMTAASLDYVAALLD